METLKWDLTYFFENTRSFYEEMEKVNSKVSEIEQFKNEELTSQVLLELLNKKWEIKELTNNILIYGSLKYYQNIKSDECIKMKNDAEVFNNEINTKLKFVDNKILELGKDIIFRFIEENPNLKIYELSIDNLFRMQEHIQDEKTNNQIKENIDAINEQLNVYNKLLKDIKYEKIIIDDEEVEITNSNIAKYLSSRDRDTRKQAYFSVNGSYMDQKNEFATILDSIYCLRIKNASLQKYNSVLENVLHQENIDSKIISSLINAVNNNLDLIQKYFEIKADILEIENPHLYDLGIPLDNDLSIKFTLEEAIEIIKTALKPLGKEYLEVVDKLLDGHIDAELDENKHQSIIFSWHTYSFMNFKGSYNDLKNLIHEIGHIVNYYLSKNKQPFIYEDSTIFVGETASLINEILLLNYLYNNANSKEEKIFYLSKQIENYFTTIYKQTMYTEFENELYSLKLEQELTAELLCEKYEKVIKKYYGNNICYDDISYVEWTRLGHLYRWSYYPYKYATGLLIASVVVNSLVNEKTLSKEQYLEFLSSGSSLYSLELLKMLNIDMTNSTIIDNGFKVLENDIKELQKILIKK